MSGMAKPHRPVDAHGDVGAAPHHLLHRLRQHGARRGLLGHGHAVLEIDQDAVRAALVRLVDELGHIARHVEDRAPDRRSRAVHFFFPLEMTPDWQSLSYSASPSSGFNSASLCSPIFGAARAQRAGRAGHARHHGMRRQLAHLLVRHLDQRFALQHVVVLHDLGDVVDRADGDTGLVEELQVRREIALGDEAADDGIELQAVANTLDVGGELGILHELGPADLDQHALGHALGRGRQAHPVAVLGLVDVARRGIGRAAAGALLHLAGELVVGGLRAQHREQGIEQRQVHHLALAAVHLDLAQRHHHRAVAVECRNGVGEIHRRQHRLAIAEAVHRGKAAIALDQGAEARLVAIAAVLAPARDAHDDQLGIDLVQLGRRQLHVLEHAGPEAFDQDLRRLRELAHDGAAGVGAQVEGHALLVAAIDLPRRLDALDAPRAQRVALGRLDLDHLGAEIGELQREHVARDQARQVDHADPVQGPARFGREGLL